MGSITRKGQRASRGRGSKSASKQATTVVPASSSGRDDPAAPPKPQIIFERTIANGMETLQPRFPWRMQRGPVRVPDGRRFLTLAQAAELEGSSGELVSRWLDCFEDVVTADEQAEIFSASVETSPVKRSKGGRK